jgi:hypothetical protein
VDQPVKQAEQSKEFHMDLDAKFYCNLDGQPDHLVPEHQMHRYWTEDFGSHPLFLSKGCQLTSSGRVPYEVEPVTRLMDNFAPMENMIWVRSMVTGTLQPFWLQPKVQSALATIQNGGPVSCWAAPSAYALTMAGALTPHGDGSPHHQGLTATLSRCADQVRARGFTPIAGLIHPYHISALRRYYHHLIRTGKLHLGDFQCSRRYHAHNESVARFFHFQLTQVVSKIVGEPVKPSYVYFASYQGGALLEKHTDRSQCEFSITFCLDYSPEPQVATPWPLQLHTSQGIVTVYQSIGDGLIYRGCQLPHSRGVLPVGHTSTSIFFHYVPDSFTGTLD